MSKYVKVKDRVRQSVTLPPMPSVVHSELDPTTYPKECVSCGKHYETSIRVEPLNQCHGCWNPKKHHNVVQSTYTLKGLRCKKKLPR